MTFRFYFDGIPIDRAPHLRRDPDWQAGMPDGLQARILPIWRDQSLVRTGDQPQAVFLEADAARAMCEAGSCTIFLGLDQGAAYYAVDVSHHEDPTQLALPAETMFEDLRKLASNIDQVEAGKLAYGRALTHWHRNHRFCGACGAATLANKGGHERVCTNDACGRHHFPRTDPAVIMLVTHPDGDKCLLGRNKRFQGLRFSTLAGFVEPGETLEQAVRREVAEESGIVTTDETYQASQPWPFPASIMLGFRARAVTTEIDCVDQELIEAKWCTRDEVLAMATDGGVLPPPAYSISRWLIDTWLKEQAAR
jgi:NAD+ diphosphatase